MPPRKRKTAAATEAEGGTGTAPAPKRTRARKAPAAAPVAPQPAAAAAAAAAPSKPPVDPRRAWFDLYRDRDEDEAAESDDSAMVIGPEGLERLCADMGVSIEGIEILIVAWQLKASRMGFFTLSEWMAGMRKLDVHSCEGLRKAVAQFGDIRKHPQHFGELYRFSFEFAKETGQKSIPLEIAMGLWTLLMPPASVPHMGTFLQFLQTRRPVRVITKDQWMLWLDFVRSVRPDMGGYEESSAWPVLLDEYAMWMQSGGPQAADDDAAAATATAPSS